ncbi:nucleotide-binding alpha-beta plait domain-containing protein [Tanacetum coccineum]
MELYIQGKDHGRIILKSVKNGPLVWLSVEQEDGTVRLKTYKELSDKEKLQADCDLKATNIVLQGLPPDVYALVNHHKIAKDIWDRVKLLMQGTSLSRQERECKLYDEFDKFSHVKGETLYQYYLRFAQLINDMNIIQMTMQPVQEDELAKLSSSIFVTNFPDKFSAKELWTVCKQYGTVVDAFIPDRRSKAGKRPPLNKNNFRFKLPKDFYKESGENVNSKSYAHVVNAGPHQFHKKEDSPAIVLDETYANKTDSCLPLLGKVKDFTSLTNLNVVLANEGFVNVKLKYMGGFWVMIVFTSEGAKETFRSKVGIGSWFAQLLQASNSFFVDERVTWIDIEGIPLNVWSKNTFSRITSKWGELLDFDEQEDGYLHSKRVCIKTTLVENIYESFKVIIQGKTFWIRAKEVSGWMPDFEEDIDQDSKSDDELSNEGSFDENGGLRITPNVEGESDLEEVAETIFEKEQASVEVKEGCNSVQKETRSEDPFNIYDLLDKKKSAYCDIPNSDDTLKYPPGFTPETDVDAQKNASKVLDMEGDNSGHKVQDVEQESVTKNNSPLNSYKNDTERSTCSGHFKKCDIPRSGGSILQLMEELIKVGQTMGYNMEGCITNIGDIINSQGANDGNR